MKPLSTFVSDCKRKKAVMRISNEILVVEFFLDGCRVGEIEYPDNSYPYVRDAADNWVTGIMTEDTVKKYSQTAA